MKSTRKVGGARKKRGGEEKGPSSPQFPPVIFLCSRLLNSADPTISESGTGYLLSGDVCNLLLN